MYGLELVKQGAASLGRIGKYLWPVLFFILLSAGSAFADVTDHFDWFWVFYESETLPGGGSDVFRPFYMRVDTGPDRFEASLMPIVFWRYRTPVRDEWRWLFNLGNAVTRLTDAGESDFDFGFFPLLFFGSGPTATDRYFLLWPFGGTLGGKFGMERIRAAVFPGFLLFVFFPPAQIFSWITAIYVVASIIPAYVSFDYREYHGWGIFWPLVHRAVAPGRDEIRIMPFFSRFHKEGWYDRYSFLLLINYEDLYLSDDVHHTFFFFPLFGRRWSDSGRVSSTAILWPLFSWGYNRNTGETSYNLPWPLVQIADCESPHIRKRIFFPFYGDYRYERSRTVFVTPLYFRLSAETQRYDSMEYYVFLVVWYFTRDYHNYIDPYYGSRWRYFKIWPLMHVEYNDQGDFVFNLLSLLPFRDREGYERLYQPFWSLVEYQAFRSGEQRLGLFLRLYYQRWGEDFFEMQIPFIVNYESSGDRVRSFTFLLSMFGYRHNHRGRFMKLFWIPIRIGDPDEDIAEQKDDERENHLLSSGLDPMNPPPLWGGDSIRFRYGLF